MAGPRKNYDEAVMLYEAGLSIAEVAAQFGKTRQAMWDVLKRRGVTFRPNIRSGAENRFYRGTTASDRSQNTLERAIRKGIVIRSQECEECKARPVFKDGRTGIQAHHDDYNKPLTVRWLCQKCHHEWHKTNKAIPERR